MRLTQQQLEAHLWGAANILRGKTAGQDYKNYILSLMFYKRLCDQWENEADEAIAELERQQGRQFTDAQKSVFRARGELGLTGTNRNSSKRCFRNILSPRFMWPPATLILTQPRDLKCWWMASNGFLLSTNISLAPQILEWVTFRHIAHCSKKQSWHFSNTRSLCEISGKRPLMKSKRYSPESIQPSTR